MTEKERLKINSVLNKTIQARYGLCRADIISLTYMRFVVDIKRMCAKLMREHTYFTTREIGKILGISHSSVVLYCKRFEEKMSKSKELSDEFQKFSEEFIKNLGEEY